MGILFIDLGEVRTFELNGQTTLGRDPKNDIVIAHPTVSRHHGLIEKTSDGVYVLIDFNSRNGIRVNGKSVQQSELLQDGDRLRIGHVRAWFFRQMPPKLPRSISNRDRGIIFKCECGQRLWSASDTAGMAVTCGGCNKSIEVPEQSCSTDELHAGTVTGVAVVESSTKQPTVCAVCQWPIERGEKTHQCPACGLDFHLDCWRENRGCSAYGCSQVNALAPKVERPALPSGTSSLMVDPSSETAMMTSPAPAVEWGQAIVALSVVSALLGLLSFGIPCVLIGLVALGRLIMVRTDRRILLLAAILISLTGTLAGLMISRFWWLQKPLDDWGFLTQWWAKLEW
ncbi:MAG: hypothetical protein KatS3mg104_2715 [Phycisphaerae bacterium]|nr:MAG: hypothetical protein KatS3mg104_2715 [Phycisphaerae bacterium]